LPPEHLPDDLGIVVNVEVTLLIKPEGRFKPADRPESIGFRAAPILLDWSPTDLAVLSEPTQKAVQ